MAQGSQDEPRGAQAEVLGLLPLLALWLSSHILANWFPNLFPYARKAQGQLIKYVMSRESYGQSRPLQRPRRRTRAHVYVISHPLLEI